MIDNRDSSQGQEEIIIAIADIETGKWEYVTFKTKEEARQAVNEARSQGKAAVFYTGGNDDLPLEL